MRDNWMMVFVFFSPFISEGKHTYITDVKIRIGDAGWQQEPVLGWG